MKIVCSQCKAVYKIADNRLPKKDTTAKCTKCQGKVLVPAAKKDIEKKPIPTTLNCYQYHGDEIVPSVVNYRFNSPISFRPQTFMQRYAPQLSFIAGMLIGWILGLLFLGFIIVNQN